MDEAGLRRAIVSIAAKMYARGYIIGLIERSDALILVHYGTLTVKRDLAEAYYRLGTLEHTAWVVALVCQLGEPRSLSPALLQVRRS